MGAVRGSLPGQRAMALGDREKINRYAATESLRTYSVGEMSRLDSRHEDGENRFWTGDQLPVLAGSINAPRINKAQVVLQIVRRRLGTLPPPTSLLPKRSVRPMLSTPMVWTGSQGATELHGAALTS